MWFWKVLHVALCWAVLCQAHRLIKKPAKTGRVYAEILEASGSTCVLLFTLRPTLEALLTLLLDGQECNWSRQIYVSSPVTRTSTKCITAHILFTSAPKQFPHKLINNVSRALPSMRLTNQQCMTAAWELLLENAGLPYHCICLQQKQIVKARLWYMYGSGHQECGNNTNLTTSPVMYVYIRVALCGQANSGSWKSHRSPFQQGLGWTSVIDIHMHTFYIWTQLWRPNNLLTDLFNSRVKYSRHLGAEHIRNV